MFRWIWKRKAIGAAVLAAALPMVGTLAFAADALVIDKDGTVSIGPSAAPLVIGKDSVKLGTNLDFGQRMAPLLTLYPPGYTIGIQLMTMYFRSDRNFAWFQGGGQDAGSGSGELDPGGGSMLMSLSSSPAAGKGTLDVNGSVTAKSIAADSVSVKNSDLLALVNQLQNNIAALQKQVAGLQAEKLSSTGDEHLRIVRGTINGNDNTVAAGSGFTLRRPGIEGVYDIYFSTPFKGIPSASVTQVFNGSSAPFTSSDELLNSPGSGDLTDNAIIVYLTNERIRIKTGAGKGWPGDRPFSFIVVGPQ